MTACSRMPTSACRPASHARSRLQRASGSPGGPSHLDLVRVLLVCAAAPQYTAASNFSKHMCHGRGAASVAAGNLSGAHLHITTIRSNFVQLKLHPTTNEVSPAEPWHRVAPLMLHTCVYECFCVSSGTGGLEQMHTTVGNQL